MSKQEKNNKLLLLYDMGVRDFNELQIMTKRAKKDPDLTVCQMEKRLEFSLQMKGFL